MTLKIDTERPPTFWEALRTDDRSLMTWSSDHPFRRACVAIVSSPFWVLFMTIVIVTTVQCLALELDRRRRRLAPLLGLLGVVGARPRVVITRRARGHHS